MGMFIHFYPRPPRGGRHCRHSHRSYVFRISIHALREEGDFCRMKLRVIAGYFYPRPPRGGRHRRIAARQQCVIFLSTPSARRATPKYRPPSSDADNFYPRPPRGGRLLPTWAPPLIWIYFYPRLREEGDGEISMSVPLAIKYFYPRPPRGGRPGYGTPKYPLERISIHALREEGDSS